MEFIAVKGMLSMPICFVQEIIISQTICAILMEQKPSDAQSRDEMNETRKMLIALCVVDLSAENK